MKRKKRKKLFSALIGIDLFPAVLSSSFAFIPSMYPAACYDKAITLHLTQVQIEGSHNGQRHSLILESASLSLSQHSRGVVVVGLHTRCMQIDWETYAETEDFVEDWVAGFPLNA